MDAEHKLWRLKLVELALAKKRALTHGVAAKLINCYLKSRFVCAGHHENAKVAALHPPIDRLLLKGLAGTNFGGDREFWRDKNAIGWTRIESEDYEELIARLKAHLGGQPLWMIEEHWPGYQ
jgi:hypothetical protein